MKTVKVKFSVGKNHPLFNKLVDAEIISNNAGYDRRQVYARTIKEVYYPEDKKGLMLFNRGVFVGYKTRPSFSEIYEGYVDEVVK